VDAILICEVPADQDDLRPQILQAAGEIRKRGCETWGWMRA